MVALLTRLAGAPLVVLCRSSAGSVRRTLLSVTGVWDPKISKATIRDVDSRWKDAQAKPSAYSGVETSRNVRSDKPFYVLCMFPYPSGKLHMGHVRVYAIGDALARYHRLTGKQVIHPIGWDAFGLPAENAAIERGLTPDTWTRDNIENMRRQLQDLGCSFDWDREIATCDPAYYKWTQFIFLKMYDKGLAYCKEAAVNWDPVDQTVLADEQIDDQGRSWRSGAQVTKKYLRQWYLRATAFSQALLDGLDSLDPNACRSFANLQRNWIGELTGCRLTFALQASYDGLDSISVFSETPELLHGVSFVLLSETHPLALKMSARHLDFLPSPESAVTGKVKAMAVNPLSQSLVPIFVGRSESFNEKVDACLGIPCLKAKDSTVCSLYGLPQPMVIDTATQPERLINSGSLTNMTRVDAFTAVTKFAKERGFGGHLCSAKLNDWLISRQRYWGTPIPIIHCPRCKTVPVPVKDLPVTLPKVTELSGKGQSPLARQTDWVNCECPRCGGMASRETDTMDTFVDSSWYFLRYIDPHNSMEPFSRELADRFMPVDVYVGGAEHACLHMYYARFVTHFLHSEGYLKQTEPFRSHLANAAVHSTSYKVKETGKYLPISEVNFSGATPMERGTGLELVETQEKMSKSKLNGIDPEEFLAEHGVDLTRLYMLAHTAPDEVKFWSAKDAAKLQEPGGTKSSISFLKWFHRLWYTVTLLRQESPPSGGHSLPSKKDINFDRCDSELAALRNQAVREVSFCTEHSFDLHIAISAAHKFGLRLDKYDLDIKLNSSTFHICFADSIIMLHPYAPLITSELWEGLRTSTRVTRTQGRAWDLPITQQRWPEVDADYPLPLTVCVQTDSDGKASSSASLQQVVEAGGEDEVKPPVGQTVLGAIKLPRHRLDELNTEAASNCVSSTARLQAKLSEYSLTGHVYLDLKRGHSAKLVYHTTGGLAASKVGERVHVSL